MKLYRYKMRFSPYSTAINAENKKDAVERLKKIYSNYNLDDVLEYICPE